MQWQRRVRTVACGDDRHQQTETGAERAVRLAAADRRDGQPVGGDGHKQRHVAVDAPGLRRPRGRPREAERTGVRARGSRRRDERGTTVTAESRCQLSVAGGRSWELQRNRGDSIASSWVRCLCALFSQRPASSPQSASRNVEDQENLG